VVTRAERAWEVLGTVLDPEVPALSVRDLGIVRDVIDHGAELEVVLTPTYSGCPATEVIEDNVLSALAAEGLGPARATLRRAPAWTTDWISEEGRRKLHAYGIAPPAHIADPVRAAGESLPAANASSSVTPAQAGAQSFPLRFFPQAASVACPRCGSRQTERLSAFGSTACKAMYRCLACREPFEHFKPI
jgi:ring-1,2-phenylacetyl-CoA epoxidase subunit PaaD